MASLISVNLVIGLLLGLAIAALIYGWKQRQNRHQKALLRQAHHKMQQMEQSHGQQLTVETGRLRQAYQARLAETIEHYQDQLALRNVQLQEEYEARMVVLSMANHDGADAAAIAVTDETTPTENSDAQLNLENQALEQEYNQRLKEVARRLQQLYEKRYAEKLGQIQANQAKLKLDYRQQLSQTIEHYQDQFALRVAELEAEYETRIEVISQAQLEAQIDDGRISD